MTKRFGFTLAEVLITLGIIGVVAAMTIPTLMNQTASAEFKTGYKKIISTLNQAITMNVALDSTDFSALSASDFATSGSIANMFMSRMNVVKTAIAADTGLDTTTGAPAAPVSAAGNYTVFFNDGMVIGWPKTCASMTGVGVSNCKAVVDVNGPKKPNKLTNCQSSSSAANDTTGTCDSTNIVYGDRFSIRFGGQQVSPNGNGARFTLYN